MKNFQSLLLRSLVNACSRFLEINGYFSPSRFRYATRRTFVRSMTSNRSNHPLIGGKNRANGGRLAPPERRDEDGAGHVDRHVEGRPRCLTSGGRLCLVARAFPPRRAQSAVAQGREKLKRTGGHLASAVAAAVAIALGGAAGASANHSLKEQISVGPNGGNGAFDAFFDGGSRDGTHAVFETSESLVASDTDSFYDIYERVGNTTSLVSTGPSGGNGPSDAFFDGVSDDGSKIFFDTDEQLVPADTDNSIDVYMRSGGTTTLISTGSAGGNGAFDVSIDVARPVLVPTLRRDHDPRHERNVAGDPDLRRRIRLRRPRLLRHHRVPGARGHRWPVRRL